MNSSHAQEETGRRLLWAGILLFLLGLLTGFLVPVVANSRMGLSSHLEGVMNGMFLVALGLLWPRLRLSARSLVVAFWLAIYSTYANWATTLLAAVVGAGEENMPLAGAGYRGSPLQEALIAVGLVSLSIGIVVTSGIVLWGLRHHASAPAGP